MFLSSEQDHPPSLYEPKSLILPNVLGLSEISILKYRSTFLDWTAFVRNTFIKSHNKFQCRKKRNVNILLTDISAMYCAYKAYWVTTSKKQDTVDTTTIQMASIKWIQILHRTQMISFLTVHSSFPTSRLSRLTGPGGLLGYQDNTQHRKMREK